MVGRAGCESEGGWSSLLVKGVTVARVTACGSARKTILRLMA